MDATSLLLFATAWERDEVLARLDEPRKNAIIGCGPVVAAAETALVLAEQQPSSVWLLGLAGSFAPETAPLGSAHLVAGSILSGVGAGADAANFRTSEALGLPTHPEDPRGHDLGALRSKTVEAGPLSLTVCAASASEVEAQARRNRHSPTLLEEMEGFAVEWACQRFGIPCWHGRAVSNLAGERDRSRWDAPAAFDALAALLRNHPGAAAPFP